LNTSVHNGFVSHTSVQMQPYIYRFSAKKTFNNFELNDNGANFTEKMNSLVSIFWLEMINELANILQICK
jgi:hypothetical protein